MTYKELLAQVHKLLRNEKEELTEESLLRAVREVRERKMAESGSKTFMVHSIKARRSVLMHLDPNEKVHNVFIETSCPGTWEQLPAVDPNHVLPDLFKLKGRPTHWTAFNGRLVLLPAANRMMKFLVTLEG